MTTTNNIKYTRYDQIPLLQNTRITFDFSSDQSSPLLIDLDADGNNDIILTPATDSEIARNLYDSDGDSIVDIIDNCPFSYNPDQNDSDANGIGDVCERVEGDLNNDGIVDRSDITIIQAYRNQPASSCPDCDIDGDGTITVLDARKLMTMCTYPRCASSM